jgi:oxygen-independent coproporphyrinogen-3 oxidase
VVDRYVQALIRRIRAAGEAHAARHGSPGRVDTVYIGGGTPTLLTPAQAEQLTGAVQAAFSVLPGAEWTVEGNPAAAAPEALSAWREGGVNRLSLGAQSGVDRELKALGRLHSWEDVCHTVADARAVGIQNINLDFMLGIPGQTARSLEQTLDRALSLAPSHLSAYCLTIEEGTPFARRGRAALGLPAGEEAAGEAAAALYEAAAARLRGAGYQHYEISNYALPGCRSRHNLHTWQDRAYLGLGIGAYSYYEGVRFGQSRDLSAFLRGEDLTVDSYVPSRAEAQEEYIMLALRLSDGLSEADFAARFGETFWDGRQTICRPLMAAGYMERAGGRVRLTEAGWLVSNEILADLI